MQEDQLSRPEQRATRRKTRVNKQTAAPAIETSEPEGAQAAHSPGDETQATVSYSESRPLPFPEHVSVRKRAEKVSRQRSRRRSRETLRAGLAVIGGRAAGALSRRLHLGGGTSIAGVIAQRLYPDIVQHLSTQLQQGCILVTGTNGKTTTSGFIAAILSDAGLRVWRNREGSNLMRGIAGALVIRTRPNGRLRRAGQAISIFEVDEAVMPQAVQAIPTRVAVFTNLFRDQLDRYGEVDSVLERWRLAVSALPQETILVLNADDPTVADLGRYFSGRVMYFGIGDHELDLARQESANERHQVMDTRVCPHCGSEYSYTLRFYSHLGHYTCPGCGQGRPPVDVVASKVKGDSFDRLRIQVELLEQQGEIVVPLPGLYNVYNALAAIATAQALGIAWDPITSGIEQFKPAFGRGERVQIKGRIVRMLLAKNPTGFNEVLRTLFADGNKRHVFFVLNDNIADGKDISWIWDVDFERALPGFATLTVAGTRARDLALRLKYAGVDPRDMLIAPPAPLRAARKEVRVSTKKQRAGRGRQRNGKARRAEAASSEEHGLTEAFQAALPVGALDGTYGIAQALDKALGRTPEGETLFIVPTYTGLLEIHRELERRGLTPHYWKEAGP
jgi:UDP-N-acetylmuramyl tripeptide synthase